MDYEDDSLLSSPIPNNFVLSFYKESPLVMYREGEDTHLKKRRESILHLFNQEDLKEFEQYSAKRPMQKQYSDRVFLLKKFNHQKQMLQNEIQMKLEPLFEARRMSEDLDRRRFRLKLLQSSLEKAREDIEQKKKNNIKIAQHINKRRPRIRTIQDKLKEVEEYVQASRANHDEKTQQLAKYEKYLQKIRRKLLNELITFVIPIRRISAAEDIFRAQRRALRYAQQSFFDGMNTEEVDNDDSPTSPEDRYQMVNSYIPLRGSFRVENLIALFNGAVARENADGSMTDFDSLVFSPSNDAYETLAALSHSCQLINSIAYVLSIKLPFNLHQCEFNTEELITDDLRANIAKLNANIVCSCLSQGIPVELTNVSYTLENLLKLLTLEQYRCRLIPVNLPQNYINILEGEVVDINRALTKNYWFDDKENNVANTWEESDYEIVSTTEHIPDDSTNSTKSNNSSPTTSAHQQSSVMTSSVDFVRRKGSVLINSFFSGSK